MFICYVVCDKGRCKWHLKLTFAVDLPLALAQCRGVDSLVAVEAGEAALVPGLAGTAHQLGQVHALLAPVERD
jgi:hypothetical protein